MAFTPQDLIDLRDFLKDATRVVGYMDVCVEAAPNGSVALRHDVDHSIDKAVHFGEWEYHNNFQSTYFILHSAEYWDASDHFYAQCRLLCDMGHEVGLHNDALCEMEGDIIRAAHLLKMKKEELEFATGQPVYGIADHGGTPFTNGDIWQSYNPVDLGFTYEAYQLQKTANTYISDNQGRWRSPMKMAQTYMLIHPTWWPV